MKWTFNANAKLKLNEIIVILKNRDWHRIIVDHLHQCWAKLLNEPLKWAEIESRFCLSLSNSRQSYFFLLLVRLKTIPIRFKVSGSFNVNKPNLRFLDFSLVGAVLGETLKQTKKQDLNQDWVSNWRDWDRVTFLCFGLFKNYLDLIQSYWFIQCQQTKFLNFSWVGVISNCLVIVSLNSRFLI